MKQLIKIDKKMEADENANERIPRKDQKVIFRR